MYAFSTHRIWSRVVPRPVLIAGMATFTIVVSKRIMKKPVVSTSRTSHGLVRACAMPTPQLFMAGVDSGVPLQRSVGDLVRDSQHPGALGLEHRDLVFQLDQQQPSVAFPEQLVEDVRKFRDRRAQHRRAAPEVLDRFSR